MNDLAAPPPHPANDLARRIDILLSALAVLVAARFRVLGILTVPLWRHVMRANTRLTRLLGQLAEGRLPRRRQRPPTPCPPLAVTAPPTTTPARPRLPARRGWVVRILGWEASGLAAPLRDLLGRPETLALLATAPTAARTLRPLCRMLGVDLPPQLQLPPHQSRPSRARPKSTRPKSTRPKSTRPKSTRPKSTRPAAPHPPMRPIYPSRRPGDRALAIRPAKSAS